MNETNLNIDQTLETLTSIRDEYVWSVHCGKYGVLRLDLGSPDLRVREPSSTGGKSEKLAIALQRRSVIPTGQWDLFVELGFWGIEAGGFFAAEVTASSAQEPLISSTGKN